MQFEETDTLWQAVAFEMNVASGGSCIKHVLVHCYLTCEGPVIPLFVMGSIIGNTEYKNGIWRFLWRLT